MSGHEVALVRAGPESLAWLAEVVGALLREDPARPVTVVAPSPYVETVLRRALSAATLSGPDALAASSPVNAQDDSSPTHPPETDALSAPSSVTSRDALSATTPLERDAIAEPSSVDSRDALSAARPPHATVAGDTAVNAPSLPKSVRFDVQLRPVAERVARAFESRAFDHPLTGPLEEAAIRQAVRESPTSTLRPLAANRSLQEALGGVFREIGHHAEAEPLLQAIAIGGSVGAAAASVYRTFRTLTQSYPDVPRQLRIAAHLLTSSTYGATGAHDANDRPTPEARPAPIADSLSAPSEGALPTAAAARKQRVVAEIGALVVYLPPRIDAAELDLLRALAAHLPVHVVLTSVGDPVADAPQRDSAETLRSALDVVELTAPAPAPAPAPTAARVHVLSAPDPDEETRSVIRRLLADMESGTPLARMAVLYSAEDPYAPLVRETLDSAGVPWHAALGRPAADGLAARSLLALLSLRERSFAREALLDWLVSRPTGTSGASVDPLPDVPTSAWDRLSRHAQVLQGAEQWVARFERLIQTLEFEEQQRQDWHAEARGHEATDDAPRPTHDIEHARAIVVAIRQLDHDTRPPGEPAGWDTYVDWAERLRRTYLPHDAWTPADQKASRALDAALESLRSTAVVEPVTSLAVFRDALASALESRRLDEGEPGVGVLVAPLGASVGVAFDRTYILGLAEGLLPSRPPVDPIAGASGVADPLDRAEPMAAAERRGFLSALSGTVLLSYARSDGAARAGYPSRWLLEQIALLESRPAIYASDLPSLFAEKRPWLEHFASAYDALLRAPAPLNLADRRLRVVVEAHASGMPVLETATARRSDLVLGRALHAARLRRSRAFTEFDGNLAVFTEESRRIARPFSGASGASSATSIERWAGCPYQYFMVNVLRVEATERPEEEWTMNALDRGTLVHAALEEFFRERQAAGRSTPFEPFGDADHARLEELARLLLADLEAQGRSGHAVAWENARAALLRDLHLQLDREEEWRREEALAPLLFERTFGDMRDAETWPAVEVALDDGGVVRFRGAIDRVDLGTDSAGTTGRALVIDYKSGGTWGYDGLADDPVLAGRHVQLALYGAAARNALGGDLTEVRAEFRFVSVRGRFERRGVLVDASVLARLRAVVQHAANGIRAGMFLPMPGEREWGGFRNCRFCDYDRICSTTRDEAWQRKKANAAFIPLSELSP